MHTGSAHPGLGNVQDQPRGVVTRQDWSKVEAAFHQAMSFEAHRRDAFIAGFAAREPELVSLLRALIAADADGNHQLFDEVALLAQSVLQRHRQRR